MRWMRCSWFWGCGCGVVGGWVGNGGERERERERGKRGEGFVWKVGLDWEERTGVEELRKGRIADERKCSGDCFPSDL